MNASKPRLFEERYEKNFLRIFPIKEGTDRTKFEQKTRLLRTFQVTFKMSVRL